MAETPTPVRPEAAEPRPPRAIRWVVDLESHRVIPVEEAELAAKRS